MVQPVTLSGLHFYVGPFNQVVSFLVATMRRRPVVVLPCSLNDLAALRQQPSLKSLYQQVDVCTTDGMPLVWYFRFQQWLLHHSNPVQKPAPQRVYGPDLMKALLPRLSSSSHRHFFYGASPRTLALLRNQLRSLAPKVQIVDTISPPFRSLTPIEEKKMLDVIRRSKTTVLWIGLSSPKQVQLALRWRSKLPGVSIMCVGAAFDFVAQAKPSAPQWMKQLGLEWLFRLVTEPQRLWKRYLVDVPVFLVTLAWARVRGRSPD